MGGGQDGVKVKESWERGEDGGVLLWRKSIKQDGNKRQASEKSLAAGFHLGLWERDRNVDAWLDTNQHTSSADVEDHV